jgi:hypothetical protein
LASLGQGAGGLGAASPATAERFGIDAMAGQLAELYARLDGQR